MDLVLKVARLRFLGGRDALLGEILAGEDDLDAVRYLAPPTARGLALTTEPSASRTNRSATPNSTRVQSAELIKCWEKSAREINSMFGPRMGYPEKRSAGKCQPGGDGATAE
jgi:hypothetical protein